MTTILNKVIKQISKISILDGEYASVSKEELGKILIANHITIGNLANHVKAVSNHHVFFNKKMHSISPIHKEEL